MTFIDSLRNYLSPQILVILCLGFISGVPYGVLMDPLNYWLSEEGIEKSTIGLLSLVFLIYSLKVFWAPLVCLLYTSPSPRDAESSRMPSSA